MADKLNAVNLHYSRLKNHLKTLVSNAEKLGKNTLLGTFSINAALFLIGDLDDKKTENFIVQSASHWQNIYDRNLDYIQENLSIFSAVPEEYLKELSMYFTDSEISGEIITDIWDDMIEMCKNSIIYGHYQRCPENGKYTKVWAGGVKLSTGKDIFNIKTWE